MGQARFQGWCIVWIHKNSDGYPQMTSNIATEEIAKTMATEMMKTQGHYVFGVCSAQKLHEMFAEVRKPKK